MAVPIALLLLSFHFQAVVSADDSKFALSIEDARKMASSDDSVFHSEFGDPEGPFRWIATSTAASIGFPDFRVRFGEGPIIETPRLNDRKIRFTVTYFANAKGNGYGIINRIAAVGETLPELQEEDPRPASHVALAKAAEHALLHGNLPLLEMLLDSGLSINEPLELEYRDTLLHTAATIGNAELIKFLLEHGADQTARDAFGNRPIDPAFDNKNEKICEILRVEESKDGSIFDVPTGLIEEAFLARNQKTEGIVFLSLNGKDPNDALTKLAKSHWPGATIRPSSAKYEVSVEKARAEKRILPFETAKNDVPGLLIEMWAGEEGRQMALETTLRYRLISLRRWRRRRRREGYGYWIAKRTSSWDE